MAQLTIVSQTVPIPASVQQKTYSDGSNIVRAGVYNESNSGGRTYGYISSATTTTIFSGQGRLCKVHIIGTGGSIGAITIYDNITNAGQIIWSKATATAETSYDLQIPVGTGITVTTAAATTVLITYE